jgi:hypothetical protein
MQGYSGALRVFVWIGQDTYDLMVAHGYGRDRIFLLRQLYIYSFMDCMERAD